MMEKDKAKLQELSEIRKETEAQLKRKKVIQK